MSNKNNRSNQKHQLTEDELRMMPTIYTFDFKDVPIEQYLKVLDVLFRNPDFCGMVEKRNALVNAAGRVRRGSSEMMNLVRTIRQKDRTLADMLYAYIVQSNLHSEVSYDFLSFSTLLKYYVNYSDPDNIKRVNRLARNLNGLTFLADMLESILVDIKGDLKNIFNGEIDFQQFNGVEQSLKQLHGFFSSSRPHSEDSLESKLYIEYSESINDYLSKRLKTYNDKYSKLHPYPDHYTDADMVDALNVFFGTNGQFDKSFIKYTKTGGCYIDAVKVAFNLNKEQTVLLDKLEREHKNRNDSNSVLKYCLDVTNVIMSSYKRSKK